jgi:hypothetical protein
MMQQQQQAQGANLQQMYEQADPNMKAQMEHMANSGLSDTQIMQALKGR